MEGTLQPGRDTSQQGGKVMMDIRNSGQRGCATFERGISSLPQGTGTFAQDGAAGYPIPTPLAPGTPLDLLQL